MNIVALATAVVGTISTERKFNMKHWTDNWNDITYEQKVEKIDKVCSLETINSVTKDDLQTMLKWMAAECITDTADEATTPDWIKVEEQLPPSGQRVLTWDGSLVAVNTYIGAAGTFLLCTENGTVTHWRPMPEAPAETISYPQVDGITPTVV